MRFVLLILFFAALQYTATGQQRIFLYPSEEGIVNKGYDTIAPYMDYYPSANPSLKKTCILVCPGGGYTNLAWEKEGVLPAKFFADSGIDVFVLKYRLNNTKQLGHRFPDQYNDVTRAIRIIRSRSEEFHIDPDKTGVMGASAGGHLASMLTTIFKPVDPNSADPLERIKTRPSFSILLYPVITMDTTFAHRGSRNMLLGPTPDESMVNALSTDKRVTPETPPVLLIHADNDKVVPLLNSIVFYEALMKNKVPASLYVFDHGGHGFGMALADPVLNRWPALCIQWLQKQGFGK
jgi:acetyl esterase/lipase